MRPALALIAITQYSLAANDRAVAVSGIPGPYSDPAIVSFYNTSATRASAAVIGSCSDFADGTMIPWSPVVSDWSKGGGRAEDCAAALIVAAGETSCTAFGCE